MRISKLLNIIRVSTRSNAKCSTDAAPGNPDTALETRNPTNPASLRDGRETKVVLRDLTPSPSLSLSSNSPLCTGKNRNGSPDSEPTSTAALHGLTRASSRRRSSTTLSRPIGPSEEATISAAGSNSPLCDGNNISGSSDSEPTSAAALHGLTRASSRRRSSTTLNRTTGPLEEVTDAAARASRRRPSAGTTDSEETSGGRSRRRVHFNPRVKVVATYSNRIYDRTVLIMGTTRAPANMFAVAQQMGRFRNNKTLTQSESFGNSCFANNYLIRVASS